MVRSKSTASAARELNQQHNERLSKKAAAAAAAAADSGEETDTDQKPVVKKQKQRKDKYRAESPPPSPASQKEKKKPKSQKQKPKKQRVETDSSADEEEEEEDDEPLVARGGRAFIDDEAEEASQDEVSDVDEEQEVNEPVPVRKPRKVLTLLDMEVARVNAEKKEEKEKQVAARRAKELRMKQRREDRRHTEFKHFQRTAGLTPLKPLITKPGSSLALFKIISPDGIIGPAPRHAIEQMSRMRLINVLSRAQQNRISSAPVSKRTKKETAAEFKARRDAARLALRTRPLSFKEVHTALVNDLGDYCPSFVVNCFNPVLEQYTADDKAKADARKEKEVKKDTHYQDLKKRVVELIATQNLPTFAAKPSAEQAKIKAEFREKETELAKLRRKYAKSAMKAKETMLKNARNAQQEFPIRVKYLQDKIKECTEKDAPLRAQINTQMGVVRDHSGHLKDAVAEWKKDQENNALESRMKDFRATLKIEKEKLEKLQNKLRSAHRLKQKTAQRLKELHDEEYGRIEKRVGRNAADLLAAKEEFAVAQAIARKLNVESDNEEEEEAGDSPEDMDTDE